MGEKYESLPIERIGIHCCLDSRFHINLKQKMAIFMDGSFCFVSVHNQFAPIFFGCRLRVRSTDDRKGWYTLLLAFPYFINLKHKLAGSWKDCFASQL